ncbi:MAG: type II toxin-antitoxin system HicA family toxin [Negativicutes bacterium]|nr:type II toxin-antitoxin system HicA family toxin [Negativicutes bacterium]
MTQKDKLIQSIKNNPDDVSFDELHKYLEMHGATWREGKGSHRVYKIKGRTLVIPRKKPLKGIYAKKAIELVDGIE